MKVPHNHSDIVIWHTPMKVPHNHSDIVIWHTPMKVPHNHSDIVIWHKKTSLCTVIDISVPLDLNISSKNQDKRNDYILLVGELQTLYPSFKYQIVPVVIGAFGTMTTELKENLQALGCSEPKSGKIIRSIQKRALIGSMKICIIVLKM